MVDRQFADSSLASLYDTVCSARADFDFYLPFLMSAPSVLDVGCGTGALLHLARQAGHTGRLCGLDPAAGMLSQARRRSDIEWVLGDLSTATWDGEFDLIVMTGHAFQVLLTDDDLHTALAAIHAALLPGGRFAFETRNPLARAWEHWTPDHAVEVTSDGGLIRMSHQVEFPVTSDLVTFTTTYTAPTLPSPQQSQSTLRFLNPATLTRFLTAAGLTIHDQFGDWDRTPLTETSPEIITITTADQAPA